MRALRLQIHDPGLFSLKHAARAAIVLPAVVFFADKVIGDQQTTFLSAFGSFAILVLADFGGPRRTRLAAYLTLAVAGAALITLGTLCSQTPWLAVIAMAVVGFLVLFSGVISGYFAAARIAALLTFILPLSIPAPPSAIPARLEGWALAASVGICAVMLLWPSQPRDRIRAGAARATRALADLVGSELSEDPSAIAGRADAANAAVGELRRSFVATPSRPTGPTGSTEALAFLVDELDWLLSFASPPSDQTEARSEPCREENCEVMAAAVDVLRASAANLDGEGRQPDLDRLDRAREAVARTLVQRVADLPSAVEETGLPATLGPSFRMRELSFAAREVGVNALRASGAVTPETERATQARSDPVSSWRELARKAGSAVQATERLLIAHANPESATFRNSLRGAAGLALAVLIGQLASLQHSFWVVLATLSVLRSNALGTGSTVLQALAGTAAGIVVGGALIAVIGTSDEPVLWALLPPAILLAAYAPRAISFAAGQAGFTIVLLILFNIIQPTGWTVGLVRVEDVAIGFAVSLAVGVLFWPRGVGDLLRESLGAAYARSADYLASAAGRLVAAGRTGWAESGALPTRETARRAANRLDDAFRDYLGEFPAQRANLEGMAMLVAGTTRVRLAAYSLSTLTPAPAGGPRLDQCADILAAEIDAIRSWYVSLANAVVDRTEIPPLHPGDDHDGSQVIQCVRQALAGDASIVGPALNLLWVSEYLDNLRQLGVQLIQPAAELSSEGAHPRDRALRGVLRPHPS